MKKPRIRKHEPDSPEREIYRVAVRAPDEASLALAIRQLGLDVDHQHHDRRAHAEVEITAFLSMGQVDELKARGWDVAVEDNLSEIGRERQKEVGKGDRFERGRIAPTGLGKIVRGVD